MIHSIKEVDLARSCLRKWSARYLHRLPDPKSPAASLGIQMHELLRAMCTAGPAANVNPESTVGALARALYPLTPPGAVCELEGIFDLFGMTASFRIDFTVRGPDGRFAAFGDWKSGRRGSPWTLTPTTILDDLQANWEANGFCKTFGLTEVPVRWLYVDKRTHEAWPVDGRFTLAGTEAWLHEHARPTMLLIEAMRAVQPVPPVQAVPHDESACEGTGHFCPYLGACSLRPSLINVDDLRRHALGGTK